MPGHQHSIVIEALRNSIAAIEGLSLNEEDQKRDVLSFGNPLIDMGLPWSGLPLGCLHEISGQGASGFASASGLVCALLGRLGRHVNYLSKEIGPADINILWCLQTHEISELGYPYMPGVFALGIDPIHIVVTRGKNDTDVLWAMEESLRIPSIMAVVGELGNVSLTHSRRLQLAAESSGVTAFILRYSGDTSVSAAVTRWLIAPQPSVAATERFIRWQLELWRCRGGMSKKWLVEWDNETNNFTVAPILRHGTSKSKRANA